MLKRWRSAFLNKVFVVAGGALIGQVVTILVSPLLSRLYSPKDFAVYSVYVSIISILLVISSFRYEIAIPLPKDEQKAKGLLHICLLLLVATSILASFLLWATRFLPFKNERVVLIQNYWLWVGLGVLGGGVFQSLSYYALRCQNYKDLATTKVTQGCVQAAVQVGAGLLHLAPLGMIGGDAIARVAGSLRLARNSARKVGSLFWWQSLKDLKLAAVEYKKFPIYSGPASLLNSIGLEVFTFFLFFYFSPDLCGAFSLSQRAISIPMILVGRAVSQVYMGQLSDILRTRPKDLAAYTRNTSMMLLAAGLPVFIMIFLLGPFIFHLIFGHQWDMAGRIARLLAPAGLVQFVVVPVSQTLNLIERQQLQLGWDVARSVVLAGFLGFISFFHPSAVNMILGYGVVMMSLYISLYLMIYKAITDFRERPSTEVGT